MDKILESWPLAFLFCVLVFFLIFRRPISDLIDRVRRMGFGDKTIDLSGDEPKKAAEQQKQINAPPVDASVATVSASHALPAPNELYDAIEREITGTLATAKVPVDVEKVWLIRAIAIARVERAHEIVYRLILGSQIGLVLQANTGTPPDTAKAHNTYEAAKAAFPDIFGNFTFETWLNYPVTVGLLKREPTQGGQEIYRITPAGRDFLHYLVNTGLTSGKSG